MGIPQPWGRDPWGPEPRVRPHKLWFQHQLFLTQPTGQPPERGAVSGGWLGSHSPSNSDISYKGLVGGNLLVPGF